MASAGLLFFALSTNAAAQVELMNDPLGRPMMSKQYTDVQGSPYLFTEWKNGSVKLQSENVFQNIPLRYDQINDELLFKDNVGQELAFAEPVVEFKIENKTFRKGYKPVDTTTPASFYEVLADGETQLLKRTSKRIYEDTPYSSATKVRTVSSTETYYLALNGGQQLVKIKKDKKSVLDAMSDKKPELEKYIKDQRLNLKLDADMVKVIAYYNTL